MTGEAHLHDGDLDTGEEDLHPGEVESDRWAWVGVIRVRNDPDDGDEVEQRNCSGSYFNMNGGDGWRRGRAGTFADQYGAMSEH